MNNVEFIDKVAGICGIAKMQVGGYANAVAEICALVKAESAPASTNTQSAAIAQIVADMRRELRDAVTFGGVICDGDVRRWMRQLRAL